MAQSVVRDYHTVALPSKLRQILGKNQDASQALLRRLRSEVKHVEHQNNGATVCVPIRALPPLTLTSIYPRRLEDDLGRKFERIKRPQGHDLRRQESVRKVLIKKKMKSVEKGFSLLYSYRRL